MRTLDIIPANQARGAYVHTAHGIVALARYVKHSELRPDQLWGIETENHRKGDRKK